MIAELLEAFGNRLHPRIVVSFQLWLFPSCFGTTYLSPSVNPLVFFTKRGTKDLWRFVWATRQHTVIGLLRIEPGFLIAAVKKKSFGKFFTYQYTSWNSRNRLHQWTQYGQCHLSITQVPQVVLSMRSWQSIRDTTANDFSGRRSGSRGIKSSFLIPWVLCNFVYIEKHPLWLLQTQRVCRICMVS